VFVTPRQVGNASVAYARDDGYRVVIVPEDIARSLRGLTDLNGNPMVDLRSFQDTWNESFTFDFVAPEDLDDDERSIYDLTDAVLEIAGVDVEEADIEEILVSETMRLDEGGAEIIGVFDHGSRQIVIRRDQLGSLVSWAGTLLHEATHAESGAGDCTFAFEEALTHRLGAIAEAALQQRA
jgi:hypothetical protein